MFNTPQIETTPLSSEEIAAYQKEGFVIVKKPVFSDEKFQRLKAHFEARLLALPEGTRPEAMDVPHFSDTALFEWLFSDEVLDMVEPILGPNIALYASHFICKPKGNGKRVPWHEDSAYWKGKIDPMEVCTVWPAIDPSTTANGCMYVIPRTHHHGFSDYGPVDLKYNVFPNEILQAQRDESRAVPCELQPNHCSLHDGKLMHGSPANTSDLRRCGYTMRYISTATKFIPERNPNHQIYLARGKDLAGNHYADPSKTYEELVRARGHNSNGH